MAATACARRAVRQAANRVCASRRQSQRAEGWWCFRDVVYVSGYIGDRIDGVAIDYEVQDDLSPLSTRRFLSRVGKSRVMRGSTRTRSTPHAGSARG